jgi:NAD(P)-dependent dehydrogenase (short-subunit alcohol dehydrogenase family)
VYATARKVQAISPLEESGCRLLPLDVTDEDSMRRAVEEVERIEGAVGVLINNAGYSQSGAVETVPIEKVRRQFETNVFGLVRMCQLVLPRMREQGFGRMVNLSSVGGKLTFPGGGLYHASKYAVEAISDALRFEVRGFGVEVVVVEPGLIRRLRADGGRFDGGGRWSLRRLRRRGGEDDARELREGTAGGFGRRPGGGRQDDRARDLYRPPAGPLHGNPVGEGLDLRPSAPA